MVAVRVAAIDLLGSGHDDSRVILRKQSLHAELCLSGQQRQICVHSPALADASFGIFDQRKLDAAFGNRIAVG